LFYAGYYTPSTSGFAYLVNESHGTLACGLHDFVKTGSPLGVVGANRQYIVGAYVVGEIPISLGETPDFVLSGAKIVWTCPNGCR
jgi:hypothetical protein